MSGSSDYRSAPKVLRLRQRSALRRPETRAGGNDQLIRHVLFSTALAVLGIGGFLVGLRVTTLPGQVAQQEPAPPGNEQVEISESPNAETPAAVGSLSQPEPAVPEPLPQSDTETEVLPLSPEPVAQAKQTPSEPPAAAPPPPPDSVIGVHPVLPLPLPEAPAAPPQPVSVPGLATAEPLAASQEEVVAAITPIEEPVKLLAEEPAPAEEDNLPLTSAVEAAPALPAASGEVAINIPKLPAQGGPALQAVSSSRLLGEVMRDCPECPELVVVVPAAAASAADASGFAIGRYEITFADWERCVSDGGCRSTPDDEGWGRDSRPVINLSYGEISVQYLPWLSRLTGASYRLPTAAEWDLAAAGGKTADGANREDGTCQLSNIAPGVERGCDDGFGYTAPAGSLGAGPLGIHDMQGNVWEWVSDCWSQGFSTKSRSDGEACTSRVLRGGSWSSDAAVIAAGARGWQSAAKGRNSVGFRVVRELP